MANPHLAHLKNALYLENTSRVLFFSTEGDTDWKNYKSIVWDEHYPSL